MVSAEERKGGAVAEADELLPEVEETILQAARQDTLLCQGCQGRLGRCCQHAQLGGPEPASPEGTEVPAWWTGTLVPPSQSLIFDEVDLSDASVAETSTKNINNSFTVREVVGLPTTPCGDLGTLWGGTTDLPHTPRATP